MVSTQPESVGFNKSSAGPLFAHSSTGSLHQTTLTGNIIPVWALMPISNGACISGHSRKKEPSKKLSKNTSREIEELQELLD